MVSGSGRDRVSGGGAGLAVEEPGIGGGGGRFGGGGHSLVPAAHDLTLSYSPSSAFAAPADALDAFCCGQGTPYMDFTRPKPLGRGIDQGTVTPTGG